MARRWVMRPLTAGIVAVGVLMGSVGHPVTVHAQGPDPGLAMPPESGLTADAGLGVSDKVEAISGEIDLTVISADAQARVAALPRDHWDLPALALALDYDPDAAFAWVRDHVGFDAYRGVLRGTVGTLGARAGNSFDRAILLRDLLDAMAIPTRFAIGSLDTATAAKVLDRSFLPPKVIVNDVSEAGRAPLDFEAIAVRARRDYARLRQAVGDLTDDLGGTDRRQALADIGRHAWVQAFVGTEWVDLDPTLPDATEGVRLTEATETMDELPPAEHQTVTVSVEAETELGGVLTPLTALSVDLPAVAAATSEIWLYFQPELSGVGGSIVSALGGAQAFVPILVVDGELSQGQPLPIMGATDIFSGEEEEGPELARVRIAVERSVPGRESERSVRVLLDRVVSGSEPAGVILDPWTANEAGPVALQPVHHVLVSTGGANPWRAAVRRAMAVEFVDILLAIEEPSVSFDDLVFPVAVANESLVLASDRAIVPALEDGAGLRAWVAEPRVFLVSVSADPDATDLPRATTDLLADPVAIMARADGRSPEVARAELWYGALESAMETEFLIALARGTGGTVRSVSVASAEPLTLFTDPEDARLAEAPETLRATLREGSIAVVPGDPASAIGWWTITADGTTRSVSRAGLGFGDYGGIRGGYPPSKPNTGPRYDITKPSGTRPAAPTGTCTAANEYTTPIGCVSLPGAIAFWGVSAAVVGVIGYAASLLWQFALGI